MSSTAWSVEGERAVCKLIADASWDLCVAVSVSEDWVAAACADGRVHVWDKRSAARVAVLASQVTQASLHSIGAHVVPAYL